MDTNSREKSSGGPFFRDINLNVVGAYNSLTHYMNSGHVQTEARRIGFNGPYTLAFTGSAPSGAIDTSFFANLGITAYIPTASRGYVKGTATGVSSSFPIVVHWQNANYQYWTYATSAGAFTSPAMVPGTYTMYLYQDEFLAATTTGVVVTKATTLSKSIAATSSALIATRTKIFQLGDYDGQPTGFRNAANQLRMHPSDARMASWNPGTYTVGTNAISYFPMAIFKDINSGETIKFTTTSALSVAATARVATTLSAAGGRPVIKVNSYTCATPAAPVLIDSRGVTRGAYRGYGEIYECVIPAGTIVSGANTMSISVASGSSGVDYLSPNFVSHSTPLLFVYNVLTK